MLTDVGGLTISNNVVWNVAGSPYRLTGDVTVAAGGSLTIESGVQVTRSNSVHELFVNGGSLTANGAIVGANVIVNSGSAGANSASFGANVSLNGGTFSSNGATFTSGLAVGGGINDNISNSNLTSASISAHPAQIPGLDQNNQQPNLVNLVGGTISTSGISWSLPGTTFYEFDGDVIIDAGGSLNIASGAVLTRSNSVHELFVNGGSLTASGVTINTNLIVNSGGVSANGADFGRDVSLNGGSFTSSGATFTSGLTVGGGNSDNISNSDLTSASVSAHPAQIPGLDQNNQQPNLVNLLNGVISTPGISWSLPGTTFYEFDSDVTVGTGGSLNIASGAVLTRSNSVHELFVNGGSLTANSTTLNTNVIVNSGSVGANNANFGENVSLNGGTFSADGATFTGGLSVGGGINDNISNSNLTSAVVSSHPAQIPGLDQNNQQPNLVNLLGGTISTAGISWSLPGTTFYEFDSDVTVGTGGSLTIASGAVLTRSNTVHELFISGGSISINDATVNTNLIANSGFVTACHSTFGAIFQIDSDVVFDAMGNDFSSGGFDFRAVGDSGATIDARNNFWGSTNSTTIGNQIQDNNDSSSRPTVDFANPIPFREFSGVVWFDENENGQLDASEAGIDGVTVNIYASNNLGTPLSSHVTSGGGLFSTVLNDNQEYVVEVVEPAGRYSSPISSGSPCNDNDLTSVTGFSDPLFIDQSGGTPGSVKFLTDFGIGLVDTPPSQLGNAAPMVALGSGGNSVVHAPEDGFEDLFANVDIADVDDTHLSSAVVSIANATAGVDKLQFSAALPPGIMTGGYNGANGTLVLFGIAPIASYQSAIRSIQFDADNPAAASTKTVSLTVTDVNSENGSSGPQSTTVDVDVDVQVYQPPTITLQNMSGTTAIPGPPHRLLPDATVTDADAGDLNGFRADVRIVAGRKSYDRLWLLDESGQRLSEGASIVISGVNVGTVTENGMAVRVVLNSNATLSHLQHIYNRVEFENAGSNVTSSLLGTRSLALRVIDTDTLIDIAYYSLDVKAKPQIHVETMSGTTAIPGAPFRLLPFATVSDPDTSNLNGFRADIRIVAGRKSYDRLWLLDESGQRLATGASIVLSGVNVGTVTENGMAVRVVLNANATFNHLRHLYNRVEFENVGSNVTSSLLGQRTLGMRVIDTDAQFDIAYYNLNVQGRPEINLGTTSGTTAIPGAPFRLLPFATVQDADAGSLDGYRVDMYFDAGRKAYDRLWLLGENGQRLNNGDALILNGVTVGTVVESGLRVKVLFNANATLYHARVLYNRIEYENLGSTSDPSLLGTRRLELRVRDVDGNIGSAYYDLNVTGTP